MGFCATPPAPEKGDLTAKNRVWGFFGEAQEMHRANRAQSLQLRQGNRLAPTKVASGRTYWPSRDPIGERGGVNVYSLVNNDPVGRIDYLGLEGLGEVEISADRVCPCDAKRRNEEGYKRSVESTKLTEKEPRPINLHPDSKESDWKREFCGVICCNRKTKEIKSSDPHPGPDVLVVVVDPTGTMYRSNGCKPDKGMRAGYCKKLFGEDWIWIGSYHSHRKEPKFSPQDANYAQVHSQVPFYMGTESDGEIVVSILDIENQDIEVPHGVVGHATPVTGVVSQNGNVTPHENPNMLPE